MNPQSKIIDLGTNPPGMYTADQLTARVDNIAQRLNFAPKTTVGLMGVNNIDYITLFLAIQKANCVVVPLNYKLPSKTLHSQIELAGIQFVVSDLEYLDKIEGVAKSSINMFLSGLSQAPAKPLPTLSPDRTLYSLFTSGSTGSPKLISYSHRDRLKVLSKNLNKAHTRTLCVSPFYHIAGINWLEKNLLQSSDIFLLPTFDAERFLKTVAAHNITHLSMVAPVMMMLLQEKDLLASFDLSSVTNIALTSSAMNIKALRDIKNYFPNATVINPYGLTEMPMGVFGAHPDNLPRPEFSVGYPLAGIDTKLIDGVLHIKSNQLASSIKNSNTEYYNTRDMFRVDDNGFYFYQGRADSMFKVGGESVYPEQIESVLNSHPSVIESAAVGKPDDVKGFKPQAFVTVNRDISEQELKTWCADKLAPYQIPKTISIIDAMPKTAIGKIDYNELKK